MNTNGHSGEIVVHDDITNDREQPTQEAMAHAYRMTLGLALGRIEECTGDIKRQLTEHTKMLAMLDARTQIMLSEGMWMEELKREVRGLGDRLIRVEHQLSDLAHDISEAEKARQTEIAAVRSLVDNVLRMLSASAKTAK